MSVYVDPPMGCAPSVRWPYSQASHMVADTHDELERMARKLDLKRQWIQAEGEWGEHYDLTATKRKEAIRLGAIPVDYAAMGEIWHRKREALGMLFSGEGR